MSNIFNLLGEIAEPGKGQVMKPNLQSKTSHEIKLNTLKTMTGTKPKGLSIRTNSDMNVSHSKRSVNIKKKNTDGNKEQDHLKLKVTQMDSNGRPISPRKEAKKLITQSPCYISKFNKSALNETSVINKSTEVQLNEDIFKIPKINIKKSHKLEKLAYWYDNEHEFKYGCIESAEKQFKDLISKKKENVKSTEERELMLETPILKVPESVFDRTSDEEHNELMSCNLSDISDISV